MNYLIPGISNNHIKEPQKWKVIVCDDDKYIHQITRLALSELTFEKKSLDILSAHSAKECIDLLDDHGDVAVILLDMIMERPSSGIDVIEHVRETMHNNIIQIIIRTGVVNYREQKKIIEQYEINEYQPKGEFTAERLHGVIISALRAYRLTHSCHSLNIMLRQQLKELVRKEVDLIQSESEIQTLINSINDSMALIDFTGTILKINSAGSSIFQANPEKLRGTPYFSYFDTKNEIIMRRFSQHVAAELVPARFRIVLSQRVYDVSMFPVVGTGNVCSRIAVYMQDTTEQKNLEQEIIRISDQERHTIGNELHDELCQVLTGISFRLKAIDHLACDEDSECRKEVQTIKELINDSIDKTRNLAQGLRPIQLKDGGFTRALELMIRDVEKLYSVTVQTEICDDYTPRDITESTHMYYIAKEGLHNAVKYAENQYISFSLKCNYRKIHMVITNTVNRNTSSLKEHKGLGLRIMKFRAERIGAQFYIKNQDTVFEVGVIKDIDFT